ncbi:OmpA family protein [Halanaerocella petrolearia]
MIGKNNKFFNMKGEEENFWPSFTDLLSVIILVILLFLVVNIISYTYKINRMRGIKKEIINELKHTLAESGIDVDVDKETGAIVFKEKVLFEIDKAKIKPKFKRTLDKFVPKYVEVLLKDETRKYISQIIIEGHTDATGGYMHNLKLAQDRAYSVVEYILGSEVPKYKHRDLLKDYMTISGIPETGSANQKGNRQQRRVEFQFRLKDKSYFQNIFNKITGSN